MLRQQNAMKREWRIKQLQVYYYITQQTYAIQQNKSLQSNLQSTIDKCHIVSIENNIVLCC